MPRAKATRTDFAARFHSSRRRERWPLSINGGAEEPHHALRATASRHHRQAATALADHGYEDERKPGRGCRFGPNAAAARLASMGWSLLPRTNLSSDLGLSDTSEECPSRARPRRRSHRAPRFAARARTDSRDAMAGLSEIGTAQSDIRLARRDACIPPVARAGVTYDGSLSPGSSTAGRTGHAGSTGADAAPGGRGAGLGSSAGRWQSARGSCLRLARAKHAALVPVYLVSVPMTRQPRRAAGERGSVFELLDAIEQPRARPGPRPRRRSSQDLDAPAVICTVP
jgi:hypothetical protein